MVTEWSGGQSRRQRRAVLHSHRHRLAGTCRSTSSPNWGTRNRVSGFEPNTVARLLSARGCRARHRPGGWCAQLRLPVRLPCLDRRLSRQRTDESTQRDCGRRRPLRPTKPQRSAATPRWLRLGSRSRWHRGGACCGAAAIGHPRLPSFAKGRGDCGWRHESPVASPRPRRPAREASRRMTRASGANRSSAGSGVGHAWTPHAR